MTDFFNYGDARSNDAGEVDLTVLKGLSEADWETVVTAARYIHFLAGERLIEAGQTDNGVYILVSGTVEVIGKGGFGGEKVIAEIHEGSVFGELAFFDAQPRSAGIRARTDGEVIHLTHEGFDRIAEANPALANRLIFDMGRVLAYRFRKAVAAIL